MGKHGVDPLSIEIEEVFLRHSAGSLRRLFSFGTRQFAADSGVDGLIGEDKARDVISHQPPDDGGIGRVGANQPVRPELEKIT